MVINRIAPIEFEWNAWNGFIFNLFTIELNYRSKTFWSLAHEPVYLPKELNSSLLGVEFSKEFLYIHFFYFTWKVFDKTY